MDKAVSIIIPSWGSRPQLSDFARLNLSRFGETAREVIISTDRNSASAVRTALQEYVPSGSRCNFAMVSAERALSKGFLQNVGFARSTGEFILLCDDDIELPDRGLFELIHAAAAGKVAYVKNVVNKKQLPRVHKCFVTDVRNLVEFGTNDGRRISVERSSISLIDNSRSGPGILCMARKLFESVQGYKSDLSGYGWEDIDLIVRIGLMANCPGIAVGVANDLSGLPDRDLLNQRLLSESVNYQRCVADYCLGLLHGSLQTDYVSAERQLGFDQLRSQKTQPQSG